MSGVLTLPFELVFCSDSEIDFEGLYSTRCLCKEKICLDSCKNYVDQKVVDAYYSDNIWKGSFILSMDKKFKIISLEWMDSLFCDFELLTQTENFNVYKISLDFISDPDDEPVGTLFINLELEH